MPRTRTTVGFEEIFHWTEEKFGVYWNFCCELFHRTEVIRYPTDEWHTWDGYLDEEVEEAKAMVAGLTKEKLMSLGTINRYGNREFSRHYDSGEAQVGRALVNVFMEEHGITECLITRD